MLQNSSVCRLVLIILGIRSVNQTVKILR